jgi:omega-6 fatty acid desaturase (delta-12 desaturase)
MLLNWLTGNIGFHHIHHLSPRVPNYYLQSVHNGDAGLRDVQTITLRSSLQSLRFQLWCTVSKKFVGFKDIKQIQINSLRAQKAVAVET